MSAMFELSAEPRSDLGKGASRRLRRAGKVPAILYGGGLEPQALTLEHLEFMNQLQNEAIYSHVLTLKLGDRIENAVLRDLQRHPFKPTILHVDFLRVSADRKLRVHIPLHFINEENALGVKQQGGLVNHALIDIEIACLPKDLPEFHWVNTVLGNLKRTIAGAHHSLKFGKYADAYLAGFAYRFNRRFNLRALVARLIVDVTRTKPRPAHAVRQAEERC